MMEDMNMMFVPLLHILNDDPAKVYKKSSVQREWTNTMMREEIA